MRQEYLGMFEFSLVISVPTHAQPSSRTRGWASVLVIMTKLASVGLRPPHPPGKIRSVQSEIRELSKAFHSVLGCLAFKLLDKNLQKLGRHGPSRNEYSRIHIAIIEYSQMLRNFHIYAMESK